MQPTRATASGILRRGAASRAGGRERGTVRGAGCWAASRAAGPAAGDARPLGSAAAEVPGSPGFTRRPSTDRRTTPGLGGSGPRTNPPFLRGPFRGYRTRRPGSSPKGTTVAGQRRNLTGLRWDCITAVFDCGNVTVWAHGARRQARAAGKSRPYRDSSPACSCALPTTYLGPHRSDEPRQRRQIPPIPSQATGLIPGQGLRRCGTVPDSHRTSLNWLPPGRAARIHGKLQNTPIAG